MRITTEPLLCEDHLTQRRWGGQRHCIVTHVLAGLPMVFSLGDFFVQYLRTGAWVGTVLTSKCANAGSVANALPLLLLA